MLLTAQGKSGQGSRDLKLVDQQSIEDAQSEYGECTQAGLEQPKT